MKLSSPYHHHHICLSPCYAGMTGPSSVGGAAVRVFLAPHDVNFDLLDEGRGSREEF